MCARCCGYYAGFLTTILGSLIVNPPFSATDWIILAVVPPLCIAAWYADALHASAILANNRTRVLAGALLGVSVARAIALLTHNPYDMRVYVPLIVSLAIGMVALTRIPQDKSRNETTL